MRYVGQEQFGSKLALALGCLCVATGLFVASFAGIVVPFLVPAMCGGVLYAALCLTRPVGAFCMAVFCQVFDQLLVLVPQTGGGSPSFINTLTAPKLMFAMVAAMLFARVTFGRDDVFLREFRAHSLFVQLCVLFVLACLPSAIYAGLNVPFLATMMRLLSCMALALVALALIRTLDALRCIVLTLLPAFAIAAGMGIYEVSTQTFVLDLFGQEVPQRWVDSAAAGVFRPLGPSGDPVYYAVSLVVGMIIALVSLQVVRHRVGRLFCLFCLGLFLVATFSTASRGGVLSGAILAGIFFCLAKIRGKWWWAGATVFFSVLCVIVYTAAVDPLPLLRMIGEGGSDSATDYRIGFWSQCIRMIADSPVLGIGLGQFPKQQLHYFDPRTPRVPYLPHNVYLQIYAETGIVALCVYVALLATCGLRLLSTTLSSREPQRRNIAAALLGGGVSLAVFAATTNLREHEQVWLILALCLAASEVCAAGDAMRIEGDRPISDGMPIPKWTGKGVSGESQPRQASL